MAIDAPNGTAAAQPMVCVFCAASPGTNPSHLASARRLGTSLSSAGYKLTYGGGTMGIMGEVAKTFVSNSTPESVEGIIPRALIKTETDPSTLEGTKATRQNDNEETKDVKGAEKTVRHSSSHGLQKLDDGATEAVEDVIPVSEFGRTTVVRDMHTRKRLMADRVRGGAAGSGFVALAGGYGTIEEVMEMVTWNQLGIHRLPIVVVNIDGYWDGLLTWVRRSIEEGFVRPGNANILIEVKSPDEVVDALRNYKVAEGRFNLDWTKE